MLATDLLINGVAVDAGLLEARPVRRCAIDECQAHCCTGGVYISVAQAEDVLAHRHVVALHLPAARRDPAAWFDGNVEPDPDHPDGGPVMGTRVLPDASHPAGESCVFLRPDRKCALQVAGLESGEHPWRFKPFYCAFHPLVYEAGRVVLGEESEMYLEGGNCNRPASGPPIPLYQLFDAELVLALGEAGYAQLAALAEARRAD